MAPTNPRSIADLRAQLARDQEPRCKLAARVRRIQGLPLPLARDTPLRVRLGGRVLFSYARVQAYIQRRAGREWSSPSLAG
jgi:hypothetical protein